MEHTIRYTEAKPRHVDYSRSDHSQQTQNHRFDRRRQWLDYRTCAHANACGNHSGVGNEARRLGGKEQAERHAMVPPQSKQYQSGENFPYLGQEYALEVVQDPQKKLVLEDRFLLAESARENAELVFRNWYRLQARLIIAERVNFFADQYELQYARVRITSARTRWGSCSSKGTLSFSWRLITTPPDVVDYVIIHELAHTVHHNHSKRFWGLVEKILPDYKERRKRLKQYGQQVL